MRLRTARGYLPGKFWCAISRGSRRSTSLCASKCQTDRWFCRSARLIVANKLEGSGSSVSACRPRHRTLWISDPKYQFACIVCSMVCSRAAQVVCAVLDSRNGVGVCGRQATMYSYPVATEPVGSHGTLLTRTICSTTAVTYAKRRWVYFARRISGGIDSAFLIVADPRTVFQAPGSAVRLQCPRASCVCADHGTASQEASRCLY